MKQHIMSVAAGLSLIAVITGCQQPTEQSAAPMSPTCDEQNIKVAAPQTAHRSDTITVIVTVKDIGSLGCAASTMKFYLSTNNVASGLINSQTETSIAAGQSLNVTNNSFTIPAAQPLGTNYIVAVCACGITEPTGNDTNSAVIVIQ